jgi:hypothetical protein
MDIGGVFFWVIATYVAHPGAYRDSVDLIRPNARWLLRPTSLFSSSRQACAGLDPVPGSRRINHMDSGIRRNDGFISYRRQQ